MRRILALLLPFLLGSTAYAGGGPGIATAGAAGKFYVAFTEQGSVEYGTRKLTITLYEKPGGRLLWKRQVDGRLYEASDGNRNFPGWSVVDSVLWISHTTGGEHWHVDNTGFRLSDGKSLWENTDVGRPLTTGQGEILFRHLQSQLAYPELRQVELVRNNLKTGEATRLNLWIPARTNCGNINDYSYKDAAYLKRWADSKFFYAQHKDACGVFVARFDWHGNEGQSPKIIPR
ncbi:hypothetical protein Dcar01_01735 [Deinococcus carri]|uniref:Lipoprotein n=1 Tax=Deinococcus carri TaxID=1211323 RepID=A0ABP9W8B1_9DEIO